MNNFSDFHTVEDFKFDVKKLQKALKQVLKVKNYDNANGIKNFAAICLNQIPGKPEPSAGKCLAIFSITIIHPGFVMMGT